MAEIAISRVIVHEIVKEQHKSISKRHIRETVLNSQNATVKKLVEGVTKVYGTRMNGAHYGTFKTTHDRGPFPDGYKTYINSSQGDGDFIALSKIAMGELYRLAEIATASTGGYFMFADYVIAAERFLLVVMIKKTPGITISPNLEPEELDRLELDRISSAAKINIAKYAAFLSASEEQKQSINYLSFISPSSSKGTSGYFISAIGCSKGSTSSQATKRVLTETEKWFTERADWKVNTKRLRQELTDYLSQQKADEKSARLSDIGEIVRKSIPTKYLEQAETIVEELTKHLNSEDIGVPVEFPVHAGELKKNTHIKGKTKNWNLEFDRMALGKSDAATVYYNSKSQTITLKNLPEELLSEIQAQLKLGS
ncbi:nucleoid-associated protein [Pseudomonas sp. gcc21]|uniref:nucleoid-associated protein n=1 Tax=Pseudomonas sp. gcc21 TaxID=2726989 RepID=UPI0014529BF1|nr:nucleoid-associated protein [Pseudomonas sp. gcc21]QJD58174.1 nucleoid-associated protein [Pseudomonas sp. gcc21]